MASKNLKLWVGGETVTRPAERPPLPSPAEVIYSGSNPDGVRKMCRNCGMYSIDQRCALLDPDLQVGGTCICVYHVYGAPQNERPTLSIEPLTAESVGLLDTRAGSSCDLCRWFESRSATDGVCSALEEEGAPAVVEGLGRCARWNAP